MRTKPSAVARIGIFSDAEIESEVGAGVNGVAGATLLAVAFEAFFVSAAGFSSIMVSASPSGDCTTCFLRFVGRLYCDLLEEAGCVAVDGVWDVGKDDDTAPASDEPKPLLPSLWIASATVSPFRTEDPFRTFQQYNL
jgi:hypothetical protein